MLKEIAGIRAYNILKKRKMETVEDVCQLFPSKYYDFSFISPLNTNRLDKNHAFVYSIGLTILVIDIFLLVMSRAEDNDDNDTENKAR